MHNIIDYTGYIGNGFKVINKAETKVTLYENKSIRKKHYWNCICDCGNIFTRSTDKIKNNTKCIKCKSIKPGQNSRIWNIWDHMKRRCISEKDKNYTYYGGRGISVCKEWLNSYESFQHWAINNGYADSLTIDRKNTNGNYDPNNCRWATRQEQVDNRRNTIRVMYNDIECTLYEYSLLSGISYNGAYWRYTNSFDKYFKLT